MEFTNRNLEALFNDRAKSPESISKECFDNICRICITKCNDLLKIKDVVLLYNPGAPRPIVKTKLNIFLENIGFDVITDNQKPQNVCRECLAVFYNTYELLKKFEISNHILNNMFNKNEGAKTSLPNIIDEVTCQNRKTSSNPTNIKELLSYSEDIEIHPKTNNGIVVKKIMVENYFCDSIETFESVIDHLQKQVKENDHTIEISESVIKKVEKNAKQIYDTFETLSEDAFFDLPENMIDTNDTIKIVSEYENFNLTQGGQDFIGSLSENAIDKVLEDKENSYISIYGPKTPQMVVTLDHSYFRRKPKKKKESRRRRLKRQLISSPLKPRLGRPRLPKLLLKNHLGNRPLKIYSEDIFKCLRCDGNKAIRGINTLLDHLQEVHPTITSCLLCAKQFQRTRFLKFHMALHSRNSLICKICRLVFKTQEKFEEHNKITDHEDLLKCNICGKRFERLSSKNLHMKGIHMGERDYLCYVCGACYGHPGNLRRHQRLHVIRKPFVCDKCAQGFTTNYALQKHMQVFHLAVEQNYSRKKTTRKLCPICDKTVSSLWFYRHMRLHPEFTDFCCASCSSRFETYEVYINHQKTHYNYFCNICFKKCKGEKELKEHVSFKHEHQSDHRCELCCKIFQNVTNLRNHMDTHLDRRPYACEVCDKRFRQSAHLAVHMHAHNQNAKPHKCDLCDKEFSYKSMLEAHFRVHTGEKPYSCFYCDQKFRETVSRHRHVKKIHPEKFSEFLERKKWNNPDTSDIAALIS